MMYPFKPNSSELQQFDDGNDSPKYKEPIKIKKPKLNEKCEI